MSAGEDLGTALARLERASRHHLAELWAEYFGAGPPPRTSRGLMIRAVAYKMQEHELGGLSAATRRFLFEEEGKAARRRVIRPGTVLIREWHGVAHQVTVGEEGVLYRGQRGWLGREDSNLRVADQNPKTSATITRHTPHIGTEALGIP